jgi:hypothetical protein
MRDDILTDLFKSEMLNEIIIKITSNNMLKDDLKSELFLILCEMSEVKLVKAHKNNYLIYMCINILKKQYHSSTSPFHKKWRKEKFNELSDSDNYIPDIDTDDDVETIMDKIKWIVETKLDVVDKELFKLYYKWDRYDRWTGDLRDTTCQKQRSSLRKIQKKLTLTTFDNGKSISIGKDTIATSINISTEKIKKIIKGL